MGKDQSKPSTSFHDHSEVLSTNPIVHFFSLCWTGSLYCSTIIVKGSLVKRSILPALPAHTLATITHGEPVRWGKGSWKHQSPLILRNKLLPAWRSLNSLSMTFFMLKKSWNNLTEPDNPTSMLWTRDTTPKRCTALFGIHLTLGYYRQKMVKLFDANQYPQRNKVETVFSCSEKEVRWIIQIKKISAPGQGG